jgi:hypothetical protein
MIGILSKGRKSWRKILALLDRGFCNRLVTCSSKIKALQIILEDLQVWGRNGLTFSWWWWWWWWWWLQPPAYIGFHLIITSDVCSFEMPLHLSIEMDIAWAEGPSWMADRQGILRCTRSNCQRHFGCSGNSSSVPRPSDNSECRHRGLWKDRCGWRKHWNIIPYSLDSNRLCVPGQMRQCLWQLCGQIVCPLFHVLLASMLK